MASEEIDAEIGGQKFSLKTASLNTVATVATLILVSVVAYIMWGHASDTKEASRDLSLALKDMTQAAREQNCLISLPQERREQNADLCKRLSR